MIEMQTLTCLLKMITTGHIVTSLYDDCVDNEYVRLVYIYDSGTKTGK